MQGFIVLPREVLEDLEPLGALAIGVFTYLISRAAWRDTLTCKRGFLFDSLTGLSDKLQIHRQSTRTLLKNLEHVGLITLKSTHRRTDIQIVNYDRFQGNDFKSTQSQHSLNTVLTQSQHGKEEVRSEEIINKQTPARAPALAYEFETDFFKVWARYPKAVGRKAAYRHFKASIKTAQDVKSINQALDNYLAHLKANGTDLQYTQNGSTWFNDWQSWVRLPSAKPALVGPKEITPAAIPAWKVIPKDEDLVSSEDVHKLLTTLSGGSKHVPTEI